jgi:hypothetical protein
VQKLAYGHDRAREQAKWYLSSIRKTDPVLFLRSFPMEIGWHILGKACNTPGVY